MTNNCYCLWIQSLRNQSKLFFTLATSTFIKNTTHYFSYFSCFSCFRMQLDRFLPYSSIPAVDGVFRHSMSLSQRFIQNWLAFPVSLTIANISRIDEVLRTQSVPSSCSFSFEKLAEECQELKGIVKLLPEVLRPVRIINQSFLPYPYFIIYSYHYFFYIFEVYLLFD